MSCCQASNHVTLQSLFTETWTVSTSLTLLWDFFCFLFFLCYCQSSSSRSSHYSTISVITIIINIIEYFPVLAFCETKNSRSTSFCQTLRNNLPVYIPRKETPLFTRLVLIEPDCICNKRHKIATLQCGAGIAGETPSVPSPSNVCLLREGPSNCLSTSLASICRSLLLFCFVPNPRHISLSFWSCLLLLNVS